MKTIFKIVSLLAAVAALFSCDDTIDSTDDSGFKVTVDKNVIRNFGGDYATFTVKMDGQEVKEGVVFHDAKNNDAVVDMPDFKFSSEETGKYSFWVEYGTEMSDEIEIMVVSVDIPDTPGDPKPESTDFKSRVLVTQFTAAGCAPCAGLKLILHEAMEDPEVMDRIVFTACHPTVVNSMKDAAFISTKYYNFSGATGVPYMLMDMYSGTSYYPTWKAQNIVDIFNECYDAKKDTPTGIAVNAVLKDGQLITKATIKAGETGNYRIGAFLLEDGIYATQNNAGDNEWMHTHDGCIRYIDSEYYSGGSRQYYGHSVGKVEQGKTADYLFAWDLDEIWTAGNKAAGQNNAGKWEPFVEDNLHVVVFVSTIGTDERGNEFYYVNNVVDCRVNDTLEFEYR